MRIRKGVAEIAAAQERSPDPCPALARTPQGALPAEPKTAKPPELGAKLHRGSRVNAPACSLFPSIWDICCPR